MEPFKVIQCAVASFDTYDKRDNTKGGTIFGRGTEDNAELNFRVSGQETIDAILNAIKLDRYSLPVVSVSVEEVQTRFGGTSVKVVGVKIDKDRAIVTIK